MKLLFITLLGVIAVSLTGCSTTQNETQTRTLTPEEMQPYLYNPSARVIRAEKIYTVGISNPNDENLIIDFGTNSPAILPAKTYREFKIAPDSSVGTLTVKRAATKGVIRPPTSIDFFYPTKSDVVLVKIPLLPQAQ